MVDLYYGTYFVYNEEFISNPKSQSKNKDLNFSSQYCYWHVITLTIFQRKIFDFYDKIESCMIAIRLMTGSLHDHIELWEI